MSRLINKVAIVTGGGTGIGEAICKKFAAEGASVIVAGFPDDPIEDVAAAIRNEGGRAVAFAGDVSIESDARACVQTAVNTFGKLDVLVNNAGVFPAMEETQDFPLDAFSSLLKNNIQSAFMMTRAALPFLQETKGNIVSAGSEAGLQGLANMAPYGGTKAFLHAFMQGLAVEQARYGVRCNCVCPGPIDTAWLHAESGPIDKEMEKMTIESTALGRLGTPEEVANVYLFLASDEASYVTGSLYSVDGGIVAAKGAAGRNVPSKIRKQPEGTLDLEHSREGEPERLR